MPGQGKEFRRVFYKAQWMGIANFITELLSAENKELIG
jgi:hypothetical protein